MNRVHNIVCSSGWWERRVERELLPWGVGGCELGDDVPELGPGFGITSRLLAARVPRLTVVELDAGYCRRLRSELPSSVSVVLGDAAELPFEAGRFSAVVCFTMLHHIPDRERQNRVLAEAARVLRPGGILAGTDSIGTGWLFRVIHAGDVLMPIDPDGLPERLSAAGLLDPRVQRGGRSFRFRAVAPAPGA